MPGIKSDKPIWAQQILAARKRLKLSQATFAEKLSTTQSNVAKWEAGSYKPSPEMFMALSSIAQGEVESLAFMELGGVPKSFFTEKSPKGMMPTVVVEKAIRDAETRRLSELAASGALTSVDSPIRHVPLLKDAAAAGTPRAVDENEISRLISIPRDWLPRGGDLYAFKVKGDSMEPILLDGHIVICDVSSNDPKTLVNKMVVGSDDGVTVKWLREDDGEYQLVPNHVSPRHPVRRLRAGRELKIVGEVVKWIGEPPPPPRRK